MSFRFLIRTGFHAFDKCWGMVAFSAWIHGGSHGSHVLFWFTAQVTSGCEPLPGLQQNSWEILQLLHGRAGRIRAQKIREMDEATELQGLHDRAVAHRAAVAIAIAARAVLVDPQRTTAPFFPAPWQNRLAVQYCSVSQTMTDHSMSTGREGDQAIESNAQMKPSRLAVTSGAHTLGPKPSTAAGGWARYLAVSPPH